MEAGSRTNGTGGEKQSLIGDESIFVAVASFKVLGGAADKAAV